MQPIYPPVQLFLTFLFYLSDTFYTVNPIIPNDLNNFLNNFIINAYKLFIIIFIYFFKI